MTGLRNRLLSGLALIFLPTQAVLAQDSPPATAETAADADEQSGEIIVEGYTEKEVRTFLWRSVIETGRVIAKRTTPICIGIDNAPDALAKPVRARIEANLAEFGVAMAEPGCRPNAVVVFDRDAHAFVNWLDKNHGEAFEALYKPEKRRLIRPVRPIYSWMYIPSEAARMKFGSQPLQALGAGQVAFQPVGFAPGGMLYPFLTGPEVISHSFTVIDIDALEGITTDQLADFLTMQMLVEFRPGLRSEIPKDSILNLFNDTGGDPDASPEMSKIDRAVLSEFYAKRRNFRNSAVRSAIARKAIETLDENGHILASR